jgi:hypothetical protein
MITVEVVEEDLQPVMELRPRILAGNAPRADGSLERSIAPHGRTCFRVIPEMKTGGVATTPRGQAFPEPLALGQTPCGRQTLREGSQRALKADPARVRALEHQVLPEDVHLVDPVRTDG